MAAAGAAAGTAAAAAERQFRLDEEAHIAHVDLNATDALQKRAFEAESETVDFKGLVVFSRLIQSQCETRAASAAGGQIDADAGLGPVGKEGLEFGKCGIGKTNHLTLHVDCLAKNRNAPFLCQGKGLHFILWYRRIREAL